MTLFEQFQVFLGSIFLGMLFLSIWSFFNTLFYKYKKSLIRLPFEILLFTALAFIYHQFLVVVCNGILNIFYPLALFIGALVYQKFYAKIINGFNSRLIMKIKKVIKNLLKKLKSIYNNIKVKFKIKRRKKDVKKST